MCSSIFSCCRGCSRYTSLSDEAAQPTDATRASRWKTAKKIALAVAGVFFCATVITAAIIVNQTSAPYHTNVELEIAGGLMATAIVSSAIAYIAERREAAVRLIAI